MSALKIPSILNIRLSCPALKLTFVHKGRSYGDHDDLNVSDLRFDVNTILSVQ